MLSRLRKLAGAAAAALVMAGWVWLVGPQMHVAETFFGLGAAAVTFLIVIVPAYRRRPPDAAPTPAGGAKANLEGRLAAAEGALHAARQDAEDTRRRLAAETARRIALNDALQDAKDRIGHQAGALADAGNRIRHLSDALAAATAAGAGVAATGLNIAPEPPPTEDAPKAPPLDGSASRLTTMVEDLLAELTPDQRAALQDWLRQLLAIRDSGESYGRKLKRVGATLKGSQAMIPVARLMLAKMKRHGFDDLGHVGKWTVGATGLGLVLFGGASAGFAAFGGAVAVPLFIVFGAGGALAGVIVDEIERRR